MFVQNVTEKTETNLFFNYHLVHFPPKNRNLTFAVHLEVHPLAANISYFVIYQFDDQPQFQSTEHWTRFCPEGQFEFLPSLFNHSHSLDLNDEDNYVHFLNNDETANHQLIIYGIREMNQTEMKKFCANRTFQRPILTEPFHFTSNYQLRVYQSACFYLNANNQWQSDGLVVSFSVPVFLFHLFLYLRSDR